MDAHYLGRPLKDFLDELAARQPTPGGGSSSALAGAIGAALGSMSAVFTTGEKFAGVEPRVKELLAKLEEARAALSALIQEDIAAYQAYVAARKLPKETEDQKAARKAAMARAQEQATAIPEAILARAHEAQQWVVQLAPLCNPNLIGDVAVAAYLLEAAARGAGIQVLCNLSGPAAGAPEAERRARAREKVRACQEMREQAERKVLEVLGLKDDT
ncbi:MAG: cyclodeaminase/cyclohydrolase family protein [Planctomycetota bacterium]|nr:cyclodeaminase/cyclohydrolase family protein [Planctomycetota bacterium]